MPQLSLRNLFWFLRQARLTPEDQNLSDGALLERFLARRDESAFEALLERHRPMVLGVCRRVLGDAHDAEDAFQATFLVLAKNAASIRNQTSVGSWLYGVAQRIAAKARAQAATRRDRERRAVDMPGSEPLDELTWQELRGILDEEVGRLPDKYRAVVVLCHLEGKSYEQAARELGCPKSTLARRLTRALELLRGQLAGRGLALSAGALATALTEKATAAPVAALLSINVVKAATCVVAGKSLEAGLLSPRVLTLAEEAMTTMTGIKGKLVVLLAVLGLAVGAGLASHAAWTGQSPDEKQPPVAQPKPPPKEPPSGPAKDPHGDPLPPGAVTRLGTLRWLHDGSVRSADFLDGKRVVTTGDDLTIRVWNIATGKETSRPRLPLPVPGGSYSTPHAALSKDGKTLATYWGGEDIYLHDLNTGKELKRLKIEAKGETPKGGRVFALALAPAGNQLACLQNDGTMQLWDWANAKVVHNFGPPLAKLETEDLALAYAPDGKSLAVAYLQGAYDKTNKQWTLHSIIKLYDSATGVEKQILHATAKDWGNLLYVGFSPDGKTLAVTQDRNITFVQAATGKVIGRLTEKPMNAGCFVFSNDGTRLYADSGTGVGEWDIATGKLLRECACRQGMYPRLSLSPDERTLVLTGGPQTALYLITPPRAEYQTWATSGGDRGPQFFDLSGKEIAALNGPSGPVVGLQFLPNGKNLLTQRVSGFSRGPLQSLHKIESVQKWDVATGKNLGTLNLTFGFSSRQASGVSPNGKFLAGFKRVSEGEGKPAVQKLVMIDVASGKELGQMPLKLTQRLPSGANISVTISISPDGKTVAVHSFGEGTIKLYEFPSGELRHTLELVSSRGIQTSNLLTTVFSPDGKMLASLLGLLKPGTLGVWDTTTGQRRALIQSPLAKRSIKGAAFSPDGRCLALALSDGTAAVFELATAQLRSTFGKGQDPPKAPKGGPFLLRKDIPCLAFSPDGKSLAQIGNDRVVRLWDILSGRELTALRGHSDAIYAVAFAPDGKTMASAGEDGTALLWDISKVNRPAPPAQALQPGDLDKHWQALAGEDAAQAFAALRALTAAPQAAVALLKERVKPAVPLDGKQVETLIAQLDDQQFKVRERAAGELLKLSEQIVPALDKALAAKPPLETKKRLEDLRSKVTGLLLQGERLRGYRAVEVLERLGTPEARQVLETLAGGAPGALLTTSAQAALRRS
ncbi:MAG: sigma-70 family RNA polymerase sigma factor [Gemmataceae bacterium]|nr:sigma-70 family RNA polymerase sigma factor [Gemmataceae bacterium]